MPAHKNTRMTTRCWKFILQCPADKMPVAQETIRSRFLEFVKLRKDGDIKEHVEKFDVTFAGGPDEGGLAVADGDATLTHRTSVDRVSFPKLRAAVKEAIQADAHLEEVKEKKVRVEEVKTEPKAEAPPVAVEPDNVKEQPVITAPVAATIVPPEIGIILPEAPPAPVKPMPKKAQTKLNNVTRANLAAARPPPVAAAIQPEVKSETAKAPGKLVFGFRK